MDTIDLTRFSTMTAEHEMGNLSEKYAFVPTMQVAKVITDHGWFPVKAQEQRCNIDSRRGYQKHIIRFRQDTAPIGTLDKVFPEVVLINSHDGSNSFSLMAGLFRLVCLNGLVIADSTFASHKVRHIGYTDKAVSMAIEDICDNVPRIANKVSEYQQIELTKDEQGAFAKAALVAKYGEEDAEKRNFDLDELIHPVRMADKPANLWNTYNTVQEKFIKGSKFEVKKGRMRVARKVTSISENVRINASLWRLTEEMAKLKGGITL
jgi:Domain of unknown function (DUF932).